MNTRDVAAVENQTDVPQQDSLWTRARAATTRQEMSTLLLVHGVPLLGLALGWHPLAVMALVGLEILLNQMVALVRHVLAPPYGSALVLRAATMPVVAGFWCAIPSLQAHFAAAAYLASESTADLDDLELLVFDPSALPIALSDAGLLVPATALLLVFAWECLCLLREDIDTGRRPDGVEPSLRILLPVVVGLWMQVLTMPIMLLAGVILAILGTDLESLDVSSLSSGLGHWLLATWVGVAIINKFFVEWGLVLWRRHRTVFANASS